MDTHAGRLPARARHFGKRVSPLVRRGNGDGGDAFPFFPTVSIDIPGLGGDGDSTSTTSEALPTTTSTTPVITTTSVKAPIAETTTTSSIPTTTPATTIGLPDTTSTTPTTTSTTPTTTPTTTAATTPTTTSAAVDTPATTSSSSSSAVSASPSAGSSAANATSGAVSKSKVSGAAIGVVVAILVLALLALIGFLVRKKFIARRQRKRGTWGAGIYPKFEEFTHTEKTYEEPTLASARAIIAQDQSTYGAYGATLSERQAPPPAFDLTPPPMSYNSIAPPSGIPPSLAPGMSGAAVGMSRATAAATSDAIVKCTFIPTLPDELSISTGQTVTVVAEYDDGWALCMNGSGERGMVPLECLDSPRINAAQSSMEWRASSHRVSSLPAARY